VGRDRIPIALTVGDPAGIGPEITIDLLSSGDLCGSDLYVVGPASTLTVGFEVIGPEEALAGPYRGRFPVIVDIGSAAGIPAGRPGAAGGALSGKAVETAVALTKAGLAEGIVTGPISKEALRLAGYRYTGHTDMLADLYGCPDSQMLMISGRFRIVILTRDIPLGDVPAAVTKERIITGVRVTAEALEEFWGIERPLIRIAALNPHGGDGGVTGSEERDVIIPAIEELKKEGIAAEGPFPADTLFAAAGGEVCDAYIALYHDQGMIPLKLSGFEEGVNMTIGLPTVRTSVCHGTAYDIARTGGARSGSLRSALELAAECCRARRSRRVAK
jgi:4-hydroxythreonine-4-phosphate dehydrogenase